jgi:hypothetical protein
VPTTRAGSEQPDEWRAAYYLLTIRTSDGRDLLRLLGRARHSMTLPVLGYADHVTVTVLGVSPLGRRGPLTRART